MSGNATNQACAASARLFMHALVVFDPRNTSKIAANLPFPIAWQFALRWPPLSVSECIYSLIVDFLRKVRNNLPATRRA